MIAVIFTINRQSKNQSNQGTRSEQEEKKTLISVIL
jgi:hypothetical protein